MRVRTHFHKDKERNFQELASALGFAIWKIGINGLLNLENEGFTTYSNAHRLEVMGEFLAFLLHATDRLIYERLTDEERTAFITALAHHIVNVFVQNKRDLEGAGDYKPAFIDFLNRRGEEYAELSFVGNEPQLDFLRHFGTMIEQAMGESPNKYWLKQIVVEGEAPQAVKTLKKAVQDLF